MPTLCVFIGVMFLLSAPIALIHESFGLFESLILLGLGLLAIAGGLWLRRLLGEADEPVQVDRGALIQHIEALYQDGQVDRETLERTRSALSGGRD